MDEMHRFSINVEKPGHVSNCITPAVAARQTAGLNLEEAAKKAQICPAYLRAVERRGGASYVLAMRLARLYGCSANVFLYSKGSETPERTASRQRRSLTKTSERRPAADKIQEARRGRHRPPGGGSE